MRNAIFAILAAGALLAAWQAQDRGGQPFAAGPSVIETARAEYAEPRSAIFR